MCCHRQRNKDEQTGEDCTQQPTQSKPTVNDERSIDRTTQAPRKGRMTSCPELKESVPKMLSTHPDMYTDITVQSSFDSTTVQPCTPHTYRQILANTVPNYSKRTGEIAVGRRWEHENYISLVLDFQTEHRTRERHGRHSTPAMPPPCRPPKGEETTLCEVSISFTLEGVMKKSMARLAAEKNADGHRGWPGHSQAKASRGQPSRPVTR